MISFRRQLSYHLDASSRKVWDFCNILLFVEASQYTRVSSAYANKSLFVVISMHEIVRGSDRDFLSFITWGRLVRYD